VKRAWLVAAIVVTACGNTAEPARAPHTASNAADAGAPASSVASAMSVAAANAAPASAPAGERWLAATEVDKLNLRQAWPASDNPVVIIDARVMLDELRTSRVRTQQPGTVRSVPVSTGQMVKKGAALMVLDTTSGSVTLKAPSDGEVVLVGTAQASKVDATRDLVVISDLSRVIVAADNMPLGIPGGAHAQFRTDSQPNKVYELKLAGISPDVPHLRGALDNTEHGLQPGDTGKLSIWKKDAQGFVVWRTALLPGARAVLVRRGDAPDGRARFVETPVTVTFDAGGSVLAVDGLKDGDTFVGDLSALP
jgi:biotin carboxyl carrier protein